MMAETSVKGGSPGAKSEGNPATPKFTLSQSQVEAIGRELAEPGWMTDLREAAYEQYHRADDRQRIGSGDLSASPSDQVEPLELTALAHPGKWPHPPASTVHGIPEKQSAGKIILVGNETSRRRLDPEWLDAGIIFAPLNLAAREAPDQLRKWMGRILKPDRSQTAALASAAYNLGALLYVPEDVRITKPVHTLFWMPAAGLQAWRMLVILEKGARVSILNEANSAGALTSALRLGLLEIHLEAGAELDINVSLNGGLQTDQRIHQEAVLEAGSSIRWASVVLGGKTAGTTTGLNLEGEGAHATWTGFSHLAGIQQATWSTMQHHQAPHTVSDLLLKVTHAGKSRSKWSGMVRMEEEAVGADGYQADRNLMLSDESHAESHPGLEILTDDVRCSHGVTVGKMDPDELFYLSSRGIQQEEGRALLAAGFFETALARLPEETIRNYLRTMLDAHVRKPPDA